MVGTRHLPLSRARSLEFEQHPPGTLLVVPGWHAKPRPLCLAIKLAGAFPNTTEGEAAVIISGSPYGEGPAAIGEIFRSRDLRYFKTVLGLECRAELDLDVAAQVDQSQQRSLRQAIGSLAISPAGVRLVGGADESFRRWAKAIDPATWAEDAQGEQPSDLLAFASDWRLRLEFEDGTKTLIDVSAATSPQP